MTEDVPASLLSDAGFYGQHLDSKAPPDSDDWTKSTTMGGGGSDRPAGADTSGDGSLEEDNEATGRAALERVLLGCLNKMPQNRP